MDKNIQPTESLILFLTPIAQGVLALIIGVVGMLMAKIIGTESYFIFIFSFVAIVFYSLINNILSLFHTSLKKYTYPSWAIFIILIVVLLLGARVLTGESIQEHKEFIKILMSVGLFYFLLSFMMRIIKAMWEFAENDEN
jgi:hypothetical protein